MKSTTTQKMEDAMKIIRDIMQEKDKEIESLKEQLQERDTELKQMKRELEDKTSKKVKFMHFARTFLDDFNEQLQNNKVGGPSATKDESVEQEMQTDETILLENFFDDESSESDLKVKQELSDSA